MNQPAEAAAHLTYKEGVPDIGALHAMGHTTHSCQHTVGKALPASQLLVAGAHQPDSVGDEVQEVGTLSRHGRG